MGIQIHIDPDRQLLSGEASGLVTLADIGTLLESLGEDTRLAPGFRQLFDLSGGDLDLGESSGADFIQAIGDHMHRHGTALASRLALVAREPHQYGLLRMYEMMNDGQPGEIRVFWTREEADAWLSEEQPSKDASK